MTKESNSDMKTNFISRYKQVFTREECRKIIEEIEVFDSSKLLFHQNEEKSYIQDQKAHNPLVDNYVSLCVATRITKKILPKVKTSVNNYLKTYSLLGTRQFLIYDCKLKKIPDGGGFHSWHYENGSIENAGRTFVIQVYLNDDFDGGETEFLYQGVREKSSTGDVLIFPASFTHVHRGNPPIGGIKYLATSWGWIQNHI